MFVYKTDCVFNSKKKTILSDKTTFVMQIQLFQTIRIYIRMNNSQTNDY